MNDNWETNVKQILRNWASKSLQDVPDEINFQMVRNLGGSGFTQIDRIATDVGEFVVKQLLAEAITPGDHQTDQALLATEGRGLQDLALQSLVRVPAVVHIPSPDSPYLVMEFVPKRSTGVDFEAEFGQRLAQMHQELQGTAFGWHADNFLGATPQPNPNSQSWPDFWLESRWETQAELAAENGYQNLARQTSEIGPQVHRFLSQLPPPTPTLIHGDLWSGNFWADDDGLPVVIDPACYYADPLAELGMLSLFGGVGDRFYSAYQEIIPFPDRARLLISIYRYYHLINHVNLFGASYLTQSEMTLAQITQALS